MFLLKFSKTVCLMHAYLSPLLAIIACTLFGAANYKEDSRIRIDGIVSPGEWENATDHSLSAGGTMKIKKDHNELYIAISATNKAWAHVYITSGDTIKVLHASAALGQANYIPRNDHWTPVQPFEWALRERAYNDDLANKQQAHYQQFGWVANNNNMGDGKTFEYHIDLSRMKGKTVSFACVAAEIPLNLHFYPTLTDHTILPKLVQGYTPDSLQFRVREWESISLR
jgi:hypothetical protein